MMTVPAVGTTYHVSPTGTDARTCADAQDPATPRQTIRAGYLCLQAGDTLLLRGGTYPEELSTNTDSIMGGTSWDRPTRFAAYPGEVPIIHPPVGSFRVLTLDEPTAQY